MKEMIGLSEANKRQIAGTHYNKPIQHWDLVIANGIPYMEAQIIKYVMRHREKNGVQDLEKAAHFLEKLIEVEAVTKKATIHTSNDRAYVDKGGPTRGYVKQD